PGKAGELPFVRRTGRLDLSQRHLPEAIIEHVRGGDVVQSECIWDWRGRRGDFKRVLSCLGQIERTPIEIADDEAFRAVEDQRATGDPEYDVDRSAVEGVPVEEQRLAVDTVKRPVVRLVGAAENRFAPAPQRQRPRNG